MSAGTTTIAEPSQLVFGVAVSPDSDARWSVKFAMIGDEGVPFPAGSVLTEPPPDNWKWDSDIDAAVDLHIHDDTPDALVRKLVAMGCVHDDAVLREGFNPANYQITDPS